MAPPAVPDRPDPQTIATFALALERLDGVGRVTAGRLLAHFPSYEALLRYPREQVLTRIKGAPNAAALVGRLFDEAAMRALLAEAGEAMRRLGERRVDVLAPHDPRRPAGLDDLPRSTRPVLLYAYGHTEVLQRPVVALFARPPLPPDPFERAQDLVRHLLPHGLVPATGAAHGFDVVVHKLAAGGAPPRPSLLVAHTGMGQLPPPMRPAVSAAVRAGGLFVSSFPMEHGPYEHDDRERALVLAALARACVFVAPRPETPEWQALTWALDARRPVFAFPDPEVPLPEAVHRLRADVDFDWVLAACTEGR